MVTGWPSLHRVSHLHVATNTIHSLRLDMLPAQKNSSKEDMGVGGSRGGESGDG